eukprot:2583187-Prymnesium_polylepis.1
MVRGLQRAMPFMLLVTFVLVPSTATRIFKAFLCDVMEVAVDDQGNSEVVRCALLYFGHAIPCLASFYANQ